MALPSFVSLPYQDPAAYFAPFAPRPYAIFLDSAQSDPEQGRYSFFSFDPTQTFHDPKTLWDDLNHALGAYEDIQPHPDLPPFQGGIMGYWGYELLHTLEKVPERPRDEMDIPDAGLGFYDWVAAFDHQQQKAWVISLKSADHAQSILEKIRNTSLPTHPHRTDYAPLTWQPDFTAQEYQDTVQRVIDYIMAGDIFQANLTQRFCAELPEGFDAYDFYDILRQHNPAYFAAFLRFPDFCLASSSPERFIRLQDQHIETRPIKGTRPRMSNPQADQAHAQDLLNSVKDTAENTMIVDLLRNDLSRVSTPESVEVPELCGLHSFTSVHHLISTVRAKLAPSYSAIDLLKATFPGGSITGAPKIRAMEIISELERCRRTAYCGAIGYLGIGGRLDTNITIRTAILKKQKAAVHVGGGIVADSDPVSEYQETLDKARALFQAFDMAKGPAQ